jgi:hypothetical protein
MRMPQPMAVRTQQDALSEFGPPPSRGEQAQPGPLELLRRGVLVVEVEDIGVEGAPAVPALAAHPFYFFGFDPPPPFDAVAIEAIFATSLGFAAAVVKFNRWFSAAAGTTDSHGPVSW